MSILSRIAERVHHVRTEALRRDRFARDPRIVVFVEEDTYILMMSVKAEESEWGFAYDFTKDQTILGAKVIRCIGDNAAAINSYAVVEV